MKMRKLAAVLLAGCLLMGNVGVVTAAEVENDTNEENQKVVSEEKNEAETSEEIAGNLSDDAGEDDKEIDSQQSEETETSDKAAKNSIAVRAETEVETLAAEADTLDAVYVSATGNDETGAGTQESPVATLAKAVNVAKDGATVYVMSDLMMTQTARYYGKNLAITSGDGGPYTLTRSNRVEQVQDAARSTYNPAMIEVDSTEGPGTASLTLTNIVLDDAGIHAGEYFVQADSEGDGWTTVGNSEVQNTSIVQDGMIATYNGVGTITLGDGAVLKNYGGMCAVRLSSGELIMKSGSQIIDDHEISREKGAKGSFGPAGAVWLQGGTITMEQGSIIGGASSDTHMNGRAIYADGGTASVGGTIQNITGADSMWQGQNGVAIHLRGGSSATLTETGEINGITGTASGNNTAIWTQFCNFTTEADSVISEVDGFQLLHFDDLDNNNYSHEVYLDGIISGCDSGSTCLLRSWYGQITLGPNSVVENCSSRSSGGLIYSNNGSHYTFAGTIRNNTALSGMIYLANQGGGGVIATIESTAHIVDNTGLGIRVNNSSNLIMNGGEIARNSSYGVRVSGKIDWKGVKFIMNGGSITDNGSYGVYCTVAGESLVEINGGMIAGNNGGQINASGDGYAVAEQNGEAGYEYAHISAGTLGEERKVRVSAGTVELPEGYADINLGCATADAVNALKASVNEQHSDWSAIGETGLWIQPDASECFFNFAPISTPDKTGLFVAYMPVDTSGAPLKGATASIAEVENGTCVPVLLEGLTPGHPYVVMLFNNTQYTLSADDTTIYTGGGQGDEVYDDGGFPAVTMYNSVDEIETMMVNGESVVEDEANGVTYESMLIDLLEIIYLDEQGNPVESDAKPGQYTVSLDWKDSNTVVRINDNEVNSELEDGTLIVRHIENVDEIQRGETTYKLLTEEPTEAVDHAVALANKGYGILNPSFYTNDEEARKVDAAGIQLLDDNLLTDLGDGRQELMEQKAAEYLNDLGEGQAYCYDFHYLDLVDAYNGNAWVSARYGTTVYLPYPEGVIKDTADDLGVRVVHYKDLHREYGIAGHAEVEEAIAASEMETMAAEFTDAGIKFDVDREGFSPFAIVWQTEAHTITASAGEGGTISPSGSVVVGEGADKSFAITPNDGYSIEEIKVDGQAVELSGIADKNGIGTYTFENIIADHTIEVTFKEDSTTPGGGEGSGGTGGSGTGGSDSEQDNTAGKDNAGQNQAVKTGDTTNVILYFILAGAALCVAAGILAYRKIRK